MTESVILKFSGTKFLRRKVEKWSATLYLTGRSDSDAKAAFMREAVKEKIERLEKEAASNK